ncbi:hypothetical protein OO013_12605 [Mangrovivirga sp. M17]|uniref:DUF304 domain-containing protein n=1 Tax=Mangrovivirga halotolerans TaxID=2993936 RepID=A0ABT3RU97_9BACT|nr:hypothetical protein [Mangrovivirga halotolerans]MCX2744715.1 hypothetical protein [Mangrovivirga halotolerans]
MKNFLIFAVFISIAFFIYPVLQKTNISIFGINTIKESIQDYDEKIEEYDKKINELKEKEVLREIDRTRIESNESTRNTYVAVKKVQEKELRKSYGIIIGTLALFVLLPFLIFGGSSTKNLSNEEKTWLTIPLENIKSLALSYDKKKRDRNQDPMNINFVSKRIQIENNILSTKGSTQSSAMIMAFLCLPVFYFIPHLYHFFSPSNEGESLISQFDNWGVLITPVVFLIVGIYLFLSFGPKAKFTINKSNRLIKYRSGTEMVTRKISELESIQINSFTLNSNKGHSHQQYELQLNFIDGSVKALFNHTGKEEMYVDAIKTARFVRKPFVDPVRAVESNPHFI